VGELRRVAGELSRQCPPVLRVGAIIYPSQLEAQLNWCPVTGLGMAAEVPEAAEAEKTAAAEAKAEEEDGGAGAGEMRLANRFPDNYQDLVKRLRDHGVAVAGGQERTEIEARLEEVEKAEAMWSCTLVRERDNHHVFKSFVQLRPFLEWRTPMADVQDGYPVKGTQGNIYTVCNVRPEGGDPDWRQTEEEVAARKAKPDKEAKAAEARKEKAAAKAAKSKGGGGGMGGGGSLGKVEAAVTQLSLSKVGGNGQELLVVKQHEVGCYSDAPSEAQLRRIQDANDAHRQAAARNRTDKEKKHCMNLEEVEEGLRKKKGRRGGGGDPSLLIDARASMGAGIGVRSDASTLGVKVYEVGPVGQSPAKWVYSRKSNGLLHNARRIDNFEHIMGDALFATRSGASGYQEHLQRRMCSQKYTGVGSVDNPLSTSQCGVVDPRWLTRARLSNGLVIVAKDGSEASASVTMIKAMM
jgi:uncharacterized protein with von Willebrand factor type A (vWA) domain